jgi:hypothetical protein
LAEEGRGALVVLQGLGVGVRAVVFDRAARHLYARLDRVAHIRHHVQSSTCPSRSILPSSSNAQRGQASPIFFFIVFISFCICLLWQIE